MVIMKFKVGDEVVLYKSRWKGLLGKWKAQIADPDDAHTFVVKGKKLRSYENI